jgi:hypothetical protein
VVYFIRKEARLEYARWFEFTHSGVWTARGTVPFQ